MPLGPTKTVRWLAGHDLAGSGALTEVSDELVAQVADNVRLGDAIKSEAPLGCVEYTISEKGFLGPADESLRRTLSGGLSVLGREGPDAGRIVTLATDIGVRKQSIPPAVDGFSSIEMEYFLKQGAEVYEDALLMHGGSRVTNNAPNAPHNGYRVDLGSGHTGGAVIALMVDPSIVARGAQNVRVNVTHSNGTSPSGWIALPVTGGTVTITHNVNGNATSSLLEVPASQAIRRYVAVSWSWGSQSTFRVDRSGGYNSGATEMHLDGRDVTHKNIVVGDVFTVSGDATVHTVTAGGTTPGVVESEFDVTFTPGLGSNAADNAVVTTVAGSHRSFKFLAAIALK